MTLDTWIVRIRAWPGTILVMNRTTSPSRILLMSSPRAQRTPADVGRVGGAQIKRYRLARERLDGRPGFAQSSASEPARSSRSASLVIP